MAKRKVTRAEIDGTQGPGIAMLVMIKPVDHEGDPESMWERLVESSTIKDPFAAAQRLWDGCKADFPDHGMAIIQNPRSTYLMWRTRMLALLGAEHATIEAYLEED